MSVVPVEKVIEKYFINQCKRRGLFTCKFSSPSTVGVPDRVVIGHDHAGRGRTVFVELKRPGGKPRLSQVAMIQRMRTAGAVVEVADSQTQINEILDRHFADTQTPDVPRITGAATVQALDPTSLD